MPAVSAALARSRACLLRLILTEEILLTINIRPVASQDRPQWETLWRGYQAFYGVDLSQDVDRLWLKLLSPTADGPYCLVAEEVDGALLGIAQYLFHSTTWSEYPRCYLNDLYTAEEARGRGVGRALIEAVYAVADARGAGQVYWLTQEENASARALYDRVANVTSFIKYSR